LRVGADALLVAAGPVMLSQAWMAAERLAGEGIDAGVVALPWLRNVDGAWLANAAGEAPVFCLDNHVVAGGQGDAVLAALSDSPSGRVHRLGVRGIPVCGRDDEVLAAHGLDAGTVAEQVAAGVRAAA
jgi:transketolase